MSEKFQNQKPPWGYNKKNCIFGGKYDPTSNVITFTCDCSGSAVGHHSQILDQQ